MLTVLSPAKSLDWSSEAPVSQTQPAFQSDAVRLAKSSRQLSLQALQSLMKISPDLARLNRDRFRAFQDMPNEGITKSAVFAFNGDTYQGFSATTLDPDAIDYAQDHVRILSGLYGVLRPLDAMQPYRLEMGSRLKTRRGASLYAYWGDSLAKYLNSEAERLDTSVLLNCASQEYFKAADTKALTLDVITPVFLEDRDGVSKTVGFFAKRARGAMARYAVLRRAQNREDLVAFDFEGYCFDEDASTHGNLVFRRPYPAAAAA